MNFFKSLKVRLTVWYVLIVLVLVAFSSTVAYMQLSQGLALKTVYYWHMRTAYIDRTEDGTVLGDFTDVFQREGGGQSTRVVRGYTSDEIVRLASQGRTVELDTPEGPIVIDASLLLTSDMDDSAEVWFYLYPTEQPGTYEILQVQTVLAKEARLAFFRRAVLVTGALTLALAAGLGFLLVWRALRPLKTITAAARGIEGHAPGRRVNVRTGDELGELASTLNRMFDRVENALETERQVASELSHELRTPLAVMQSEATQALKKEKGDAAYQKALETVSREVSHVSSVAERLLFLARSEHSGDIAQAPVDLKDLLTEVGWDAEVLCEEKNITFKPVLSRPADRPEDYVVTGDATRLRELFLNLINNAVRYTPEGGTISLSLEREARWVRISVSDTGIGIPGEHLPHIFERFYRVKSANTDDHPGVGLGLAICKRIAELHGGSIEVKSRVGEGSTFTVFLPSGDTPVPRKESR